MEAAQAPSEDPPSHAPPDIANWVRNQWFVYKNWKNNGVNPINERLLRAQRAFEGKYDPEKSGAISEFGGSQIYSRLVASKCRTASALLREVYLGPDRPWSISPVPDPPVPDDIKAAVVQKVTQEMQGAAQAGQPVGQTQAHMRFLSLMHAAQQAARGNAMSQAKSATDALDDILWDGGFYEALREFIADLCLYPFACLKGPVVRLRPKVKWANGRAVLATSPTMCWERVSPFNIYWTPGAARIEDADVIERLRLTRADLNDMLGVPGFDEAAIRGALEDYGRGYRDWLDSPDAEQAINENREDPNFNQSGIIDALTFTGRMQGVLLLAQGVDPKLIPDPMRDYSVQTWVVGKYTLKTMLNPSPRQRHGYYVSAFEKIPGSVIGHGLNDILEDHQEAANAAYRALVNNLAMSSGPQVVINTDAVAPNAGGYKLEPWKRWEFTADAMGQQGPPITFFQPQSNAGELMQVIQFINGAADDQSAIPRYISGSGAAGAGRTASGLSMLMNNAEKILQTVAGNIDADVMNPALTALYDMTMLTDTSGLLTGEEEIQVKGVDVAAQQETERQKQLQFLQLTANPIDAQIVGIPGRAKVLRSIASNLGLPEDIVPDDQTIQAEMAEQAQKQAVAQAMAARNAGPNGGPGGSPLHQGAAQAQGNQAPTPTPERLSDNAAPNNQFQQGMPAS